jgi:hypothetical protein
MRKALVLAIGIGIAVAAAAVAEENMQARIDRLIARWAHGDAAAQAGVAAETRALGDAAITELYRRLARESRDFPGPELGTGFSSAPEVLDAERLVNLEVRIATPAANAVMPKHATLLGAEAAAALLKDADEISAPQLTTYDGQRANISISNQQSYTRTIDGDRNAVAGTVQSGLMLEVRPRLIDKTNRLSMELRCVRAELDGEIPEIDTAEGRIGAPVITKREFAITLVVESDQSVALALPGTEPLLLRIKAVRLEPEAR